MPATAVIPAAAGVLGSGLSFFGKKSAQEEEARQAEAALEFQRQQALQEQKNWEAQQEALKRQWEADQQAKQNEIEYRRSIAAPILAKYGIGPQGFSGGGAPSGGMPGGSPSLASIMGGLPAATQPRSNTPSGLNTLSLADIGFGGMGGGFGR